MNFRSPFWRLVGVKIIGRKVKKLFQTMDSSGDGTINKEDCPVFCCDVQPSLLRVEHRLVLTLRCQMAGPKKSGDENWLSCSKFSQLVIIHFWFPLIIRFMLTQLEGPQLLGKRTQWVCIKSKTMRIYIWRIQISPESPLTSSRPNIWSSITMGFHQEFSKLVNSPMLMLSCAIVADLVSQTCRHFFLIGKPWSKITGLSFVSQKKLCCNMLQW